MNRDNVTLVYLVKEILHQVCNANVVKMAMSKQKFLEVLEFGDGIIAVPHCLPALFTLNAWNTKNKCHTHHQVYPSFGFRTTSVWGFLPMPTWASRIMLTSLAPSPMDRVIGQLLEFFTNLTIWGSARQRGNPFKNLLFVYHVQFIMRHNAKNLAGFYMKTSQKTQGVFFDLFSLSDQFCTSSGKWLCVDSVSMWCKCGH